MHIVIGAIIGAFAGAVAMIKMAAVSHDRRMMRAKEDFMTRHHYCPGHCVNFGPCNTCSPEPNPGGACEYRLTPRDHLNSYTWKQGDHGGK